MSSVLDKALAIVEYLVEHPEGRPVTAIAADLDQPASGVHRLLGDLMRHGYVRQVADHGAYALTIKLPSMGLGYLGRAGVTDVAQPILDRLARETGELIRLSVIDGDDLVWVGVAQGATGGLRYDPGREQGVVVHLACSAGGQAWLATMTDDEVIRRVGAQGLRPVAFEPGPGAPRSLSDLLRILEETRARGHSLSVDSYMLGMTAMAVPVRLEENGPVAGCLSVAGPGVRVTAAKVAEFVPLLQAAAAELGQAALGSGYFRARMQALGRGAA